LGEQTVADLASFIMALASGLIFVFVLGENEGRRCFEEWTGMLCALAGIVRVENAAEGHESVEDALVAVFWHGSGPVAGDFLRTSILLEPRSASGFGVGRGMVLPELERVPGVFPDLRAALHLPEMQISFRTPPEFRAVAAWDWLGAKWLAGHAEGGGSHGSGLPEDGGCGSDRVRQLSWGAARCQ